MRGFNSKTRRSGYRWRISVLLASLFCWAPFAGVASAQSSGVIEAGVTIPVRTTEEIEVNHSDGRIFSGVIDADVPNRRGQVALPRGSYVELIVRQVGDDQYALDLESVTVNGHRMGISTNETIVTTGEKEGLGKNKRTGKFVGGGALVGAIVGAITGGGKGAAIGGGLGAAAGAGAQVLTRGKDVEVPPETLLTFHLESPLRIDVPDRGFSRNGNHYHAGYGTIEGNSAPYQAGLLEGREDRRRGRPFDFKTNQWRGADLSEYRAGYERGFQQSPDRPLRANGSIRVGDDHYVIWRGPETSRVYVQVDASPRQLFGTGSSGSQPAPWITRGHQYVFILEDGHGRELDRDETDLRGRYPASD